MQPIGSVDSVIAAIRDESAAELEQLRARADQEIATIRGLPVEAADRAERERRITTAHKRNEELMAQADWDARRRIMEAREEWTRRVVARGREILSSLDDWRREAINARLIAEARASLHGEPDEITTKDGCVVRCGAIVFDNSFEERARRLEPVWRKALAEMYSL
ncbi:MAG TPA: hypothetical protein VLV78_17685 [Thermoanaerobaculia bacterium]|nr:hypothetical protein [Thermoanaerobaculia bacterium]